MRVTQMLVAGLAAALLAASAQATVLTQMSVQELTQQADLVVIAQVQDQWVQWHEDIGRVRTYTRVRLLDVLVRDLGTEQAGTEVVIAQEGGFLEDQDWGVYVAGNARLAVGEVAVLFLTRGEYYYVLGMEQGKYSVSADADEIERVYRTATVPVMVQQVDGTQLFIERPVAPLDGRPLSELLEAIGQAQQSRPQGGVQ